MKNLSKKILSIICVFAFCVSLSITAFASESANSLADSDTGVNVMEVTGYARLLTVGPYEAFNGSKTFTVKPAKGHHLTVQANVSTSPVTIKAKKKGALFYSKTITVPADGKSHTYKMISNCNGKDYVVTYQCNGLARFISYICQTQYN